MISEREVTKEEFFAAIGPKNVHPTPEGRYPYTSIFYDPHRTEHGRIVDSLADGTHYPVVSRYYLP